MLEETVTIKDVARVTGLHPSTVSLCLNNSPKVAEKTRLLVQKAARDMNYSPHPHLKALMRSRRLGSGERSSPTVGFVTFFPNPQGWRERFPAMESIIDGARRKAHQRGFKLEELWMPVDQHTGDKVTEYLQARGISGVLLSSLPRPMNTLDWPWERLAAVAIGPSLREPRLHRVRSDHFKSMCAAMRHCHRLGYRRPGIALLQEVNRRMDYRWMAAYLTIRIELNLTDCPEPLCPPTWSRDTFLHWIRSTRPDVVFLTKTDQPLQWLREEGLSVPRDIGVVTLSTLDLNSEISGIHEHWDLQGERAMMILGNLLTDNEFGLQESPVISVVDGSWIPGRTVRNLARPDHPAAETGTGNLPNP